MYREHKEDKTTKEVTRERFPEVKGVSTPQKDPRACSTMNKDRRSHGNPGGFQHTRNKEETLRAPRKGSQAQISRNRRGPGPRHQHWAHVKLRLQNSDGKAWRLELWTQPIKHDGGIKPGRGGQIGH